MATAVGSHDEWDKDTDEIALLDSGELHSTRPNRWAGAPSSWRHLTEEDRRTWDALEGARREDLALHLYNAHALKRRARGVGAGAGIDIGHADGDGAGGDDDDDGDDDDGPGAACWRRPGKDWTAWPLRAAQVPRAGLMGTGEPGEEQDRHEAFTIRRPPSPSFPSESLEEELSATMLRLAKEKLRESFPPGRRAPVPTADDEHSYRLLRPAVRRILGKLDGTLTLLHNARMAGLDPKPDSGRASSRGSTRDDDEEDGHAEEVQKDVAEEEEAERGGEPADTGNKADKTQPKGGKDDPPGEPPSPPLPPPDAKPAPRRGRPRAVVTPLPGETELEMQIRIARQQKKRLPSAARRGKSEEGAGPRKRRRTDTKKGKAEAAAAAAAAAQKKPPPPPPQPPPPPVSLEDMQAKAKRLHRSRNFYAGPPSLVNERFREDKLGRWGLRDWRDVLGAAAMAGFPRAAVERAAQRCADLLGGDMTLHVLHEKPLVEAEGSGGADAEPGVGSRGKDWLSEALANSRHTLQFAPRNNDPLGRCSDGGDGGGDDDDDDDDSDESSSAAESAAETEGEDEDEGAEIDSMDEVDEMDQMDQMDGAVHVDGFLQPIRVPEGWRGMWVVDERAAMSKPREAGRRGVEAGRGRSRGREGGDSDEAEEDDEEDDDDDDDDDDDEGDDDEDDEEEEGERVDESE